MKYDITSSLPPQMPTLGKGTECIRFIAAQVSPDMRQAIVPMLFPPLGAYIKGTSFMYPDHTWKEISGQMAHLIADSGMGKGQLSACVEAIMRQARAHDQGELQKLVEWQKQVKTKGANKEKPARPEVHFLFPPADVTNPAFVQNAMACEQAGGCTQYFNMPEIEMADRLCGGHRQVSQVIRNIYDCQRAGALRATADGVTGNPLLRVNATFSSTPFSARRFYKTELYVGTFGRIPFSYRPRTERSGEIPVQGEYGADFLAQLDGYIQRLQECEGQFVVHRLNALARRLAREMAEMADLADDDVLWDMSKRSIVSAWKNGCILWVLNRQVWTRAMADLVEWMVYHDLWSKLQVFGDLFQGGDTSTAKAHKKGPKNMLEQLPDHFSQAQLEELRVSLDKSLEQTKVQLAVWKNRGFITQCAQTGLWSKTDDYLNQHHTA